MRSKLLFFGFAFVAVLATMLGAGRLGSSSGRAHGTRGHPVRVEDPEHPCGPVSAAVAAGLVGETMDLTQASSLVKTDPLGRTSMAELVSGLQQAGLGAVGIKLTPRALARVNFGCVILFVRNSHFAVALPTGNSGVVLVDPPGSPRFTPTRELTKEWKGDCVLVTKDPASLAPLLDILGLGRTGG